MSLFEAQDASDIVSQAATSDVNIIFGTSIDESLGDEVRVTVIATGIDKKKAEQGRLASRRTRSARPQPTARPHTDRQTQDNDNQQDNSKSDPLGNWDIRKEPAATRPAAQDEFSDVEKKDFDPFQPDVNSDDTKVDTSDDSQDDIPPFFKHRRRGK